MRVLWVVNIVLPQVAHLAKVKKLATGGWINSMLSQLSTQSKVELGVVMRAPVASRIEETIDGIRYYLVPSFGKGGFDIAEAECQAVLSDFKPDLLHVEGTEFAHARTFLQTWSGPNVVSLQGIINGYEPYQYGGLPVGEMLFSGKLTPALSAAALIYRKRALFKPRLKLEVETIRLAKNILGRTTWDRAHAYSINPSAPYFSANRVLRDAFYQAEWRRDEAEPFTIFIGNSAAPLKGAHFVLRAVAQLRSEFPKVKVNIAGEDPRPGKNASFKSALGYGAYLQYLVNELGIEQNVNFTGLLQADDMAERLRKSHVYVLCSTIENSPNTLGEAMVFGVPCVAAYVGGAPDMALDGHEALFYRDNDPAVLAYQIKRIFESDELAAHLSERAKVRGRETHDPSANMARTLGAYHSILGDSTGMGKVNS